MKIGIIATHSFPIPYANLHTGDFIILTLAKSLRKLDHEVTLYAPEGSDFDNLKPFQASFGKYPPSVWDCENDCYRRHLDDLLNQDIIHDFSTYKTVTNKLNTHQFFNTCSTLMGGAWLPEYPPHNLIVWSQSHRTRVLSGYTDYENTPLKNMGAANGKPVQEAHVVYGGIDTDFYFPTYKKQDYILWLGRWHQARGFRVAIEVAKRTGLKMILAGEHPDNEMFESQKQSALEAVSLVKNIPNIEIVWLPQDPEHHAAKRELYQGALAFLNPTQFHEPFGMSQVEAMACGTPVITTNYGSMPEIIKHGKTGLVCHNDIYSLAQACYQVKQIDYYSCRTRAVEHFDQKIMAQSYLSQYHMILNGQSW